MVSNAGSWMETVAVGALIKSTTGRNSLVALAAVAAFLPIGLLSPLGGALADRVNRRRFLIILNCFEATVAATLAVLAARDQASAGVLRRPPAARRPVAAPRPGASRRAPGRGVPG